MLESFLILIIVVIWYFIFGTVYMLWIEMWRNESEWDNAIWLIWVYVAFREWRLHRYLARQNKKWDNY